MSTASRTGPESPAQSWLAELLADRVRSVTARAGPGPVGTTTVLVLVRSLRLADLVQGARGFAAALEPAEAAAWLRSWTRTMFLFGNPANLPVTAPARIVAPGSSAAWLGPFAQGHRPGLGRLLKPVTGRLPQLPGDLDLPGNGPRWRLQVAVAGLSLADYLVHLHHTLAEAVLLGRLGPDEPVRLSHRPTLAVGVGRGLPDYARVLPEPEDTGLLRLHTWLSRAEAGC